MEAEAKQMEEAKQKLVGDVHYSDVMCVKCIKV